MTPTRRVALAFFLAALVPWGPAEAQQPRAERPTLAVGDRWVRSDGLYDLVRIENDQYVFSAGPGREIHLTRDLTIAHARRGDRSAEVDPPPRLAWPLQVGKSGWDQTRFRHPNMPSTTSVPATVEWKVETVEPVEVAGTTVEAFRVTFVARWSGRRGSDERRWSMWYAPEVTQWVKGQSDDIHIMRFEVVAFERTAPPPLTVALQSPREAERVTSPLVELAGKASGGRGIARAGALRERLFLQRWWYYSFRPLSLLRNAILIIF